MKILVIYNFYDNQNDPKRKKNLEFFLEFGVRDYPEIEMLLICRNSTLTVDLSNYTNVHAVYLENVGICINGYKFGLNTTSDLETYDYVVLMNDSVIGPFTKSASPWYEIFINSMSESIHLVGPYRLNSFICSFFLFTDKIGIQIIKDHLNTVNIDSPRIALSLEGSFSKKIKAAGYEHHGLNNGVRWTDRHDIFNVVFEKANKIGTNTSIFWQTRKNQDISYIKLQDLVGAVGYMNTLKNKTFAY